MCYLLRRLLWWESIERSSSDVKKSPLLYVMSWKKKVTYLVNHPREEAPYSSGGNLFYFDSLTWWVPDSGDVIFQLIEVIVVVCFLDGWWASRVSALSLFIFERTLPLVWIRCWVISSEEVPYNTVRNGKIFFLHCLSCHWQIQKTQFCHVSMIGKSNNDVFEVRL